MSRQVNLDWLKTTFEEIKSGQKKYDDCLLAVYGEGSGSYIKEIERDTLRKLFKKKFR